MGLGGYLMWTAVVREIKKTAAADLKIIPVEAHQNTITKIVQNPVFENNPDITYDVNYEPSFFLELNKQETNYCKLDAPTYAVQRRDKHVIAQICEHYDIKDPLLKCELYLTEEENRKAEELLQGISQDFITIEPYSKANYTPNRTYSFEKWQKIVDEISKYVDVVQIGFKDNNPVNSTKDYTGKTYFDISSTSKGNNEELRNVKNLAGKTTFRESAAIIGKSKFFISTEGGLVHAASAVETKALVIMTGYSGTAAAPPPHWSYPQNINVNISSHGPCGLKIECPQCVQDVINHNENEIIDKIKEYLEI